MNLAITGALGHIGSRLIRDIPSGMFDRVILIDNLSTQRYASLFNLPEGVPFHFFEEDIVTADLKSYFSGIDVVVHLAALTDAEASLNIPERYEKINRDGTKRVAEACIATGSRLLFPSTTSVYGVQDGEVDETCPRDKLYVQSPYAKSKLEAEYLIEELGSVGKLKYVIFRFGTIFGSSIGMRFHTAVNKFTWQACNHKPLTVWTSAYDQLRPYLDLRDANDVVWYTIWNDLFDNSIYNAVTVNTSVREIVRILSAHVKDVQVKFTDSRIMNQLSYTVSSKKICDRGFEFHGSLETGIKETINILNGIRQQGIDL